MNVCGNLGVSTWCVVFSTSHVCAVVPEDIESFHWRHALPGRPPSLKIYEVHVGISSEKPHVAQWSDFRQNVLPYVAGLGYTALLLLAVHEHGYYASFGYQVTSFFAPSSRFGKPSELQALIDEWDDDEEEEFLNAIDALADAGWLTCEAARGEGASENTGTVLYCVGR